MRLTPGGQGLGIALVAAQKAQIPVTIIDNSQASIDKGLMFAGLFKVSLSNGVNILSSEQTSYWRKTSQSKESPKKRPQCVENG